MINRLFDPDKFKQSDKSESSMPDLAINCKVFSKNALFLFLIRICLVNFANLPSKIWKELKTTILRT